ncbi:MAG: hypothetical protein KBC15_01635 [Candidatus Levybacteria bacterium]|nr:hypothetical protein [Candidatus Levybacteria bacterium]
MINILFGANLGVLFCIFARLFIGPHPVDNREIKGLAVFGAIIGTIITLVASPWILDRGPMSNESKIYPIYRLHDPANGPYLILQRDGEYVADIDIKEGVQLVPIPTLTNYHLEVIIAPRDDAIAIVSTNRCINRITLWTICWRSTTEVTYRIPTGTQLDLLSST